MSTCPYCQAPISVPRLWWNPLKYNCATCGKESRPSQWQHLLCIAPGLLLLVLIIILFRDVGFIPLFLFMGTYSVLCAFVLAVFVRFVPID
jgi:hypothetical protein